MNEFVVCLLQLFLYNIKTAPRSTSHNIYIQFLVFFSLVNKYIEWKGTGE